MKRIKGRRKVSKLSTKDDIICSMPDIVITHILNRMPIIDGVRTSILARNSRYKWTMITQLVFGLEFDDHTTGLDYYGYQDKWYDEGSISRLFIHLKGPITKVIICVPHGKVLNVENFYHWVLFLSRKGIMEFTFMNMDDNSIKLPTHIFSCLELTHLKLDNCHFPAAPTTFGCFPNLLSLELDSVTFSSGFHLIFTPCPVVEILKIDNYYAKLSKVKLVEIAKFKNLRKLSLHFRSLDCTPITSSLIISLGDCFPKLQKLFLSFQDCKFEGEAVPRKFVCGSFSCVKTLTLAYMDLSSSIMLPLAFEIIWGCPNLQTLTIPASFLDETASVAIGASDLEYITMGPLQLLNVVFYSRRFSENELFFIKMLLAHTPLLKKITIHPHLWHYYGDCTKKLMLTKKLLMFHRASAIAEVDFRCY
ncbi:F-box/FBD/LRR-repeat protein At1g13570-like [Rutidosis leptorrhynchoides]|uniref:F-box/FBD/LRR-repeat protein At1g13570-like n=1 Tax=Rutidosis leptorrhynchoides TaxID=125765 RepID=UPI003A994182